MHVGLMHAEQRGEATCEAELTPAQCCQARVQILLPMRVTWMFERSFCAAGKGAQGAKVVSHTSEKTWRRGAALSASISGFFGEW